jgi:ABC-2 type transport system ATP-binding protein
LAEQLSGGMLKRLDIACALIHDPKILILDEPTADLDPYHRTHMWELIRRIHAKGTTIILSSHFLDELEDLCDRIGIIYKGRMDHIGTSHELKKTLVPHEKIHIETKKKKYKEIEEILVKKQSVHKWKHIEITEHELILTVDSAVPFVMDLPEYVKSLDDEIIDIQIVKPTLTEVFSHIMNQSPDKHVLDEIVNTQSPDQAKTKKKRKNK